MAPIIRSQATTATTAPTQPTSFLAPLTPSLLPHIPYTDKEKFLADLNTAILTSPRTEPKDWFMLTGVTPTIFAEVFRDADGDDFAMWSAYDEALEWLLVRWVHNGAPAMWFYYMILDAAGRADPGRDAEELENRAEFCFEIEGKYELQSVGRTTRCIQGFGMKDPDMSWELCERPQGRSKEWPVAVLEVVGDNDVGKAKAQMDLAFWSQAKGEVGIVFIIRIGRAEDVARVHVEKWVWADGDDEDGDDEDEDDEDEDEDGSGGGGGGRYKLGQRVQMMRKGQGALVILNGPLIIDLERLYLRPPVSSEGERDMVIDVNDLWELFRRSCDV
jgi:hypothetical protein